MHTIVTITGIRPDFIRMSSIFEVLDRHFNHILIHTGQHYDNLLSGVFFEGLGIRAPDYNLEVGRAGVEHFHQLADSSVKIIELFRREKISPDLVLFLGDSNSVCCSISLKKEGFRIGHIEAGMRSYDRRMLEETNRIVCDHCSDLLFVYHEDYKMNLIKEGIDPNYIFVISNTIVEPCLKFANSFFSEKKRNNQIFVDIHRPENFKYENRLKNILAFVGLCKKKFGVPVKLLKFPRTIEYLRKFGLQQEISSVGMELVDMMPYLQFLHEQYHSLCLISDSGTAQEEPALLNTLVFVPRDFTERPQSVANNCSRMVCIDKPETWIQDLDWFDRVSRSKENDASWLGDNNSSEQIIDILLNRVRI